MTGTITYILYSAGYRAMNGPLADERRRLAGAEPPSAYVSYDPRLLAGAGWYGYRIALKGGDRQMLERARYMLSERYVIRDGYEYYADGVYVFGVLLRERVPRYGTGGGAPTPEPESLNFYMPEGGTLQLVKTGSPTTVTLEYLVEGAPNWVTWQPASNGNRVLTLQANGKVYIRNTSTTSTGFSTSKNDFYQFLSNKSLYANGNINSLLCKNPEYAVLTPYCFQDLFYQNTHIITPPEFPSTTLASNCYRSAFNGCSSLTQAPELPATTMAESCYTYIFFGCSSLTKSPVLPATTLSIGCYSGMFYNCSSLTEIRTQMTDISAASCLTNWVRNVSPTGDLYCPAELTIPTGVSGIPSGWTRHDI